MATAAPPDDPVALSYPLTALAAVAAMFGFATACLEFRVARQRRAIRSLLSHQRLAALNGSVVSVVAAVALLLLLVAGDHVSGVSNGVCGSGARLALVAHSARLACDVITASVSLAAFASRRCTSVRPNWLRRGALLVLHVLAWVLAACVVLLPRSKGPGPCGALPLVAGADAAVLLALDWSLLLLSAAAEITAIVIKALKHRCFPDRSRSTSPYSPGSVPSAWSASDGPGSPKTVSGPGPPVRSQWGVHPAELVLQLLLLLPLSVMAFQDPVHISAPALLALRWLFFYLLVALVLLNKVLHGWDLLQRWREGSRRQNAADLNPHLVPTTLQEIQRLEDEPGMKTPGVLKFRAKWRQMGQTQLGVLRIFSPTARALWSAEAAAAQLLNAAPHPGLCRYLWSSAGTPFHAGLACFAEEPVTKAWRVTCRADLDRGSLDELLRTEAFALSEGFIYGVVTDLARGLVHLRQLSLVHGRISPEVVELRSQRDGSFRAVLCDFHLSRRLVDLSLCNLSEQSFAYSLSSRSGLLDALRDQQFAPDLRSLLLLMLQLLLTHLERRNAVNLARASASPSLERVAEEEEDAKWDGGGGRREGVYEALDPLTSAARSQSPSDKRQRRNGGSSSFDNGGFESREDLSSPSRPYENLPPAAGTLSSSRSGESSLEHPDLVRTAVEQRRKRHRRSSSSPPASTPRPPSSAALLNHEEEFCLRLARAFPKLVEPSVLLRRERRGLLTLGKTMRAGLSQLGAEMSELALTVWAMEPCISAESFLRSLKAATPRSAL